ncbi:MAG: hypothetical protein ACOYN0_06560 [Phycisphaerales bacterium]
MRSRVLSILGSLALTAAAAAQSTAFTYQGELKSSGVPANGTFDLRFSLFNAAGGGLVMTAPVCIDNLQVTDGHFSATIDFGRAFVTAGSRFIQIDVRQDTGLDCANLTGFTTMTPRSQVTAAPSAIYAHVASGLTPPNGTGINAVSVDSAGKVGIGTTAPTHSVHVATVGPTIALQDTAPASQQAGYVSYRDNGNVERAWVGYGSPGDTDFSIVNARSGGDIVLNPFSGNVGIGTATPAARLEVRGDVRLGSSGQYFAASGEQNLRILRGSITTAGNPFFGAGWTSTRISTGWYSVTYNTGFGDAPTVVAMSASSLNVFVTLTNDNGAGFDLQVRNASGTLVDAPLRFISVGVR